MNDKVNFFVFVIIVGRFVLRMFFDENVFIIYKLCDFFFLIMFLGENVLIDYIM